MFNIVSCSAFSEFSFYAEGNIYQGAFISNKIYRLIAQYSLSERIKAIQLAWLIEKEEESSIVSVGLNGQRKVWVEVSSKFTQLSLTQLESLSITNNTSDSIQNDEFKQHIKPLASLT